MKIRFNMMFNCEQIQIRTLEDLRNNFFVEDVLRSFNDGILERWLDARYYTHELKAVKELKESGITNAREILEGLIHIFVPDMKTEEINSELSMYDYLEERKKFWEYVRANGLNEIEELRRKNEELLKENSKLQKILEELSWKYETLLRENTKLREILSKTQGVLIEADKQLDRFAEFIEYVRKNPHPISYWKIYWKIQAYAMVKEEELNEELNELKRIISDINSMERVTNYGKYLY